MYICFLTTERLCRQSRVPKPQVQLATVPYLYDNRDPINQRAYFLFRLSLQVDPFLRWPALNCFSLTHRFQPGKMLSQVIYCTNFNR